MTLNRINNRDAKIRSYDFSLEIIKLVDDLKKDTVSEVIAKQILRSATSIGANIIEAQASPTRRDFSLFLSHSLKSANETVYWLNLLKDSKKSTNDKIEPLVFECEQLCKILGSSILTMKTNGYK